MNRLKVYSKFFVCSRQCEGRVLFITNRIFICGDDSLLLLSVRTQLTIEFSLMKIYDTHSRLDDDDDFGCCCSFPSSKSLPVSKNSRMTITGIICIH